MRPSFLLLASALLLAIPTIASASHGSADEASPNMLHVASLPPAAEHLVCDRGPVCFNSDLAFWDAGGLRGGYDKILVQGNYEGFRLVDVSDPADPAQISAVECRTNQGDVSFYKARNRLLVIQSIEEAVSSADCATATENPVVPGTNPVTNLPGNFRRKGHEGLRIFDVTDPRAPAHIATVRTACGSHTHTTIRDEKNRRAIVYVSSYPNGVRVTRREDLAVLPEQPNCIPDHNKISIVEIPDANPAAARVLREQPLDSDTATWSGVTGNGGSTVRGCHDITIFEFSKKERIAAGACLEEGQLWDISNPAFPTADDPGEHTHIRNPFINGPNPPFRGLFHTASLTWDGDVVVFTDEWQGGGAHGCDGPPDTRGNVWFYENVEPGDPAPLFGRFILPRPQPASDVCSMHNGNVIPTNRGYFGVSSAYQAGTTVYDFSDVDEFPPVFLPVQPPGTLAVPPTVASEVAFFDAKNDPSGPRGIDDAWSSYWHNDYVYASSGLTNASLTRPGARGLDVYLLLGRRNRLTPPVTDPNAKGVKQFRARNFPYQNPQSQERFQTHGD